MEGDKSKPLSLPDNTQLSELTDRVAENVVEFQHFADEIVEAIDQDEKFSEMTTDSYNRKKAYMKSQIRELSQLHNSLADECSDLIEDVCKHCQSVMQKQHLQSSDSSSSPRVTQSLAPNFSKATGFDLLWNPSGSGFYLSKVSGSSHSGSEASMSSVNKPAVPPVNDDALKVKETKDPDCGGSESFMTTVKKVPVSAVNEDALKVEETKDSGSEASVSFVKEPLISPTAHDDALKVKESNEVLLEKISSLEETVASLKQNLKNATNENHELKHENEENLKDIRNYKSLTKREIRAMEIDLQAKKEFTKTIDVNMSQLLAEKIGSQSKHYADMNKMDMKMKEYANEISLLKSRHEKKEKIWKVVTERLKDEIKEKSESLAKETKNMEALIAEKSDQNNLIHKLETELISVKFEIAGLGTSFENVEKIADELKLKMVELDKVVDKQMETMSDGDKFYSMLINRP